MRFSSLTLSLVLAFNLCISTARADVEGKIHSDFFQEVFGCKVADGLENVIPLVVTHKNGCGRGKDFRYCRYVAKCVVQQDDKVRLAGVTDGGCEVRRDGTCPPPTECIRDSSESVDVTETKKAKISGSDRIEDRDSKMLASYTYEERFVKGTSEIQPIDSSYPDPSDIIACQIVDGLEKFQPNIRTRANACGKDRPYQLCSYRAKCLIARGGGIRVHQNVVCPVNENGTCPPVTACAKSQKPQIEVQRAKVAGEDGYNRKVEEILDSHSYQQKLIRE